MEISKEILFMQALMEACAEMFDEEDEECCESDCCDCDDYDDCDEYEDNPLLCIDDVIFNGPATIIKWDDGTKTVVKCQKGEEFDKEKGFAMAILKKLCGNSGVFNDALRYWCEERPAELGK